MVYEEGYYWLQHPDEKEQTLVYFYVNPDTNEEGFGFNIKDGGGFLPLKDLSEKTKMIPAGLK